MQRQEYTLNRDNNLGRPFSKKNPDFVGFYDFFCKFGIDSAFGLVGSAEKYAKMVYKNVESPKITIVAGKPGASALYSGRVLLLKIRDNHIIRVCMPGIKSLKNNYSFCGDDFEYTTWASFPDLVDGGDYFLDRAYELKYLGVPVLKYLGTEPLAYSQLPVFNGPELVSAGDYFLYKNENMVRFNTPKFTKVGRGCLYENNIMDCNSHEEMEKYDGNGLLYAPNLRSAGINCNPLIYRAIKNHRVNQK